MSDSQVNHHPDWNIKKGDYKPHSHSTNTYAKKLRRKNILKKAVGIVIYAVILGIVVYLILSWN